MGILGEIWKGVQHSYKVNKAFLQEAPIESIPIIGPALLQNCDYHPEYDGLWAEIRVRGLLDKSIVSRCRAVEIGTLRAAGIDVLGYSEEGFYVKSKDRNDALAILRGTGLSVE